MRFQGSVIKEQGVTFAVVVVKKNVLDNHSEADRMIRAFYQVFPGVPIVLMAQNYSGVPSYYGRSDIVRFLANIPMESIPWKEYSVNI
ncbi:MAG: hypothetical protein ABSD46_08340 [Bacteroidota bacterium]